MNKKSTFLIIRIPKEEKTLIENDVTIAGYPTLTSYVRQALRHFRGEA